jgi:hypothetical protein
VTPNSRFALVVNHPKTFLPSDRQQLNTQTSALETRVDTNVVLRVIDGGAIGRSEGERRRLARWAATWAPSQRVLAQIANVVARAS